MTYNPRHPMSLRHPLEENKSHMAINFFQLARTRKFNFSPSKKIIIQKIFSSELAFEEIKSQLANFFSTCADAQVQFLSSKRMSTNCFFSIELAFGGKHIALHLRVRAS